MIAGTATTYRLADHGRAAAYDAEARAWGGSWYEDAHTSPTLAWEDFKEIYGLAVDWAIDNLLPEQYRRAARRNRPTLRQNTRRHDFAVGSFMRGGSYISVAVKARNGLRLSSLLHEVAHWCVEGGKPHGAAWKSAYVSLVREFCGDADADRLEAEFFEKPAPKRKRRPRRTYSWAYKTEDGVWMRCKRKDIEFDDTWSETYAKAGYVAEGWLRSNGRHVRVHAEEVNREMTNA